MKYTLHLILTIAFFILCGCSLFDAKPEQESGAIPVVKNWQIIEEPPKLSDDSGRLPFQKEQSVQPEVAKPLSPAKNRIIQTP
jgi:hypothetical protein